MNAQREVLDLLRQHGRFVRRNKHLVYDVNGYTVIVATSASDDRGWLNLRAIIRRALKHPAAA